MASFNIVRIVLLNQDVKIIQINLCIFFSANMHRKFLIRCSRRFYVDFMFGNKDKYLDKVILAETFPVFNMQLPFLTLFAVLKYPCV
jgi:hypothetical protein